MIFDDEVVERYRRDGVVRIRSFFTMEEVAQTREELSRYVREDLDGKPADACTREADGKSIRNLWRLEQHNGYMHDLANRVSITQLVAKLVRDDPVLMAVETFNKPVRVGSAVPYHQDNAYFCLSPPDALTLWAALDAVTVENGAVYFLRGTHARGMLPTKPSGVKGNSIGLAEPPSVPLTEQFCCTLHPGDVSIHHCQTIHHSAPNKTDHPRLGLLLVYRGAHTRLDPALRENYNEAAEETPPA